MRKKHPFFIQNNLQWQRRGILNCRTVSETCRNVLFLDLLYFVGYVFLDLSKIRKV